MIFTLTPCPFFYRTSCSFPFHPERRLARLGKMDWDSRWHTLRAILPSWLDTWVYPWSYSPTSVTEWRDRGLKKTVSTSSHQHAQQQTQSLNKSQEKNHHKLKISYQITIVNDKCCRWITHCVWWLSLKLYLLFFKFTFFAFIVFLFLEILLTVQNFTVFSVFWVHICIFAIFSVYIV